MLALLRNSRLFFGLAALAAIAVRAAFIVKFHRVDGDSLIYGDIARNWLAHGIFGLSTAAGPIPTYIRLPGYPAFLAAIWSVTGPEHYTAVLIVQLLFDVAACFLIADLTRRVVARGTGVPPAVARASSPSPVLANKVSEDNGVSARSAKVAFFLAAVCPFLSTYVATPLTETLAIFFAAAALDAAVAGLHQFAEPNVHNHQSHIARVSLAPWILCGIAVAASILLRPDGGILLACIEAYLVLLAVRTLGVNNLATVCTSIRKQPVIPSGDGRRSGAAPPGDLAFLRRTFIAAVVLGTVALAPLVPWTIRNCRDFHRFQPLAPRYANAPDERVNYGFERWTKTWMLDFVSVSEIYWNMPDAPIDTGLLPNRAFDSPEERDATEKLFAEFETTEKWTPALDAQLGRIADGRIARAPLRYYVWLPLGRIADMWLRPRTELLGVNDRWWEFRSDPHGALWGSLLGLINLLFISAAIFAVFARREHVRYIGLIALFILLRSAFLGTLENPEPRYTLECYPAVIVLAAATLGGKHAALSPK